MEKIYKNKCRLERQIYLAMGTCEGIDFRKINLLVESLGGRRNLR